MIGRLILAAMAAFFVSAAAAEQITAPAVGSGSPLEGDLYHYKALVTRVIDGDTVLVDIDLGFHTWVRDERIRLYGINAPEKNAPGGAEATAFLAGKIEGKPVILETIKGTHGEDRQEKFGRYLGIIWLDGANINQQMLDAGHAAFYMPR
jgi:micrococcal nuclease